MGKPPRARKSQCTRSIPRAAAARALATGRSDCLGCSNEVYDRTIDRRSAQLRKKPAERGSDYVFAAIVEVVRQCLRRRQWCIGMLIGPI